MSEKNLNDFEKKSAGFGFDSEVREKLNIAQETYLAMFLSELIHEEKITTAIDAGTGVLGFFARILKNYGLEVTAFDGREDSIIKARKINPGIRFERYNVEDHSVSSLGKFDMTLCFGLLYHLESPFLAIRNLFPLTKRYLLVDTEIAPYKHPFLVLCQEPSFSDQGLTYVGVRPTESALIMMLYKAGFSAVYRPHTLPDHQSFRGSLARSRARTILLASVDEKSSSKKWGKVEFTLIPEPNYYFGYPKTWGSTIRTFFLLIENPKLFFSSLTNWWKIRRTV